MAKLNDQERKQLVDNLITNCGCQKTKGQWAESDRATLNTFPDEALVALERKTRETVTANAAQPPAQPKPKTAAEWLAEAPPEIQSVVANAMQQELIQKNACIELIVTNTKPANPDALKASLVKMDLANLVALAAPFVANQQQPQQTGITNFAGAASPFSNNQQQQAFDENDQLLPLPTVNWGEGAGDLSKLGIKQEKQTA